MATNITELCLATQEHYESCMELAQVSIAQTNYWDNLLHGVWLFAVPMLFAILGAVALILLIYYVLKLRTS